MERVKKGEKYWHLAGNLKVESTTEQDSIRNKSEWLNHNYFHTEEEANQMIKKLQAVLRGADVIEMPSEEEFEMIAELEYPTGTDDYLLHKGIKLAQMAFNSGVNWLKSKVIK